MNKKIVITPESYLILKKKIARLEKTKVEIAERLSLSSLDSDLSENGDFITLLGNLEETEKNITKLNLLLANVEFCQKTNSKELVGLGSLITYKILNTGEKKKVEITDAIEANPPQKISANSPLGANLLGKKVGDIVENQGKNKYRIQILAINPSSLVEILKLIEYEDKQIPEIVLQRAAKNGKLFHQIIQEFIQTGANLTQGSEISPKIQKKLQETMYFLEKNKKLLSNHCFLGSERLHHSFYKGVLVATYIDLEFADCVVELKTNNIKMHESPLTLLAFQIQLLIQHLCTKKEVYLL
ncbi:10659_t:CDS:2 [Entrophospora sp. SA101]|nr:10659_t:CDS:2 [Entrophospora sp. SA101]CAJ0912790.1 20633_t:CDS:2 [Entrophospora sp. SA101]